MKDTKQSKPSITPDDVDDTRPRVNIPTFIFLDTNAVIDMLEDTDRVTGKPNLFNWKNILKKVKDKQFGFKHWENDCDKVWPLIILTFSISFFFFIKE